MSELLRMEKITKKFENIEALKRVDLTLKRGEILGLIGDNGAGKSTLIKILMGVYEPDSGKIYFKGKECRFSSPEEARRNGIEAVYQDGTIFNDLNVVRNIFVGREVIKKFGLLDFKKMKEEARALLTKLNLKEEMLLQTGRFCSGGERQGIEIGRAMHFKADIVILDEPTRALGITGVNQVQEFVTKLHEEGIACIYITHTLDHLFPIAHRFVILSRGEKITDVLKKNVTISKLSSLISRKTG